jgi:hypothetical protein
LDLKDLRAIKATKVIVETMDFRDGLEIRVNRAYKAKREIPEILVRLAPKDHRGIQDPKDPKENRVYKDRKELLGVTVNRENRALKATKENRVPKDP